MFQAMPTPNTIREIELSKRDDNLLMAVDIVTRNTERAAAMPDGVIVATKRAELLTAIDKYQTALNGLNAVEEDMIKLRGMMLWLFEKAPNINIPVSKAIIDAGNPQAILDLAAQLRTTIDAGQLVARTIDGNVGYLQSLETALNNAEEVLDMAVFRVIQPLVGLTMLIRKRRDDAQSWNETALTADEQTIIRAASDVAPLLNMKSFRTVARDKYSPSDAPTRPASQPMAA